MDPIKTLGKFLKGGEQRDAVHVAVMPVVAAEDLRPGDHVGLVYGTTDRVKARDPHYELKPIGIIDPFLKEWEVKKGKRVWLWLYPGTITGLRHDWTCPAVDERPPAQGEHEQWLRDFADRWDFVYDDLIAAATAHSRSEGDNWITRQGRDLHTADELGQDHDLFWEHLEAMTGREFDAGHRGKFGWSCSC